MDGYVIDLTPSTLKSADSWDTLSRLVSELAAVHDYGDEDDDELLMTRLRIKTRFVSEATSTDSKETPALVATLCVIADLINQGWRIDVGSNQRLSAQRPTEDDGSLREQRRRRYQSARDSQLRKPSIRSFVAKMERPKLYKTGRHSIFSLFRDGRELHVALSKAVATNDYVDISGIIKPYLQFVDSSSKCQYTGLALMDVWRYFRHTWSNPYESIPGRSMLFLVRDAASQNHPVIGLGAISSAAVQLSARDHFIGWLGEDFCADILEYPKSEYVEWINNTVNSAIEGIYRTVSVVR